MKRKRTNEEKYMVWLAIYIIVALILLTHMNRHYAPNVEPRIEPHETSKVISTVASIELNEGPEPEEGPSPSARLSDVDFELICRLVAAEARGECYEGQKAVAQVVRDRMEHPNTRAFGGPTAKGVIYKKGQFAKPWQGDLSKYPDIHKAVTAVFYEDKQVFDDTVVFFYAPKTASSRGANSIRKFNYVGKIGAHNFHGDRRNK